MEQLRRIQAQLNLWRTRFWHFRHGGLKQLNEYNRRYRARGNTKRGTWRASRNMLSTEVFPLWDIPDPETWRERRNLTVGVIADPFTSLALSYEWQQVSLTPAEWKKQVELEPLDFLFIESAWHGNNGAWQYQLTGSQAPSEALRELVQYCKTNNIPTVFWNKEDPTHFEDFIDTAQLFDYVFTTDVDRLDDYRERLGHDQVFILPFAAQLAIHNPIRLAAVEEKNLRDVAFAGTYFRDRFPERRQQMEILLGGALDAQRWLVSGLDIYSRFGELSSAYAFPKEYASRVRGELSPVLSTESPALDAFFPPHELLRVTTREQAKQWIRALTKSPELRDRMTHLAMRRIWKDHTYAHRMDTVLQVCGIDAAPTRMPTVTAMVSTYRPHQVTHVLDQLAHQHDVDCEPVILTHGFTATDEMRSYAREHGLDVQWMEGDTELTLGECYNRIVERSSGECLAKIDDDDLYGPYYLFDQLAALRYSNADIVGKGAYYVWLENRSILGLRFEHLEHRYSDFVSGPTIVARREAYEEHPFISASRGEDSHFLRDVTSDGGQVFSSSRFGFIQVRNTQSDHTWNIEESEILSSTRVVSFTKDTRHVIF
ncbi:MAG: glycosyltransferase [Actinobacteria bacterium]|nr:MAG: glycosyltransferase [Actinomycetota bacterium]